MLHVYYVQVYLCFLRNMTKVHNDVKCVHRKNNSALLVFSLDISAQFVGLIFSRGEIFSEHGRSLEGHE